MSSQTHETETFTAVATALIRPETEQERERRRIVVMCLPFFVLATFAAFIPLVVMARMSVSADQFENSGFSMEAWYTLATESVYLTVAWNTLWFATLATVASVIFGVGISHALEKYEFPFKGFVVSMISFPIALPGIVVAFMIIVLLGRQGLLTHTVAFFTGGSPLDIAVATTVFGLFCGYVYSLIPRSTMVLRGTYTEVNTDAEEAARALGAGSLRTFYHVTLPEIRPGVVAAFILTFRSALAIFGTVLVLQSLNVATLRIDREIAVGFNSQIAGAIGLIYFAFILAFTFVSLRFTETDVVEI
ncbi:ABC transporter permease [Natrialba swarupiae]|uniref:ABC transporter permease n=1 Tax=Natrialba swarupiae TaxID=2448032 RepID=UPI001EE48E57|nr:ABC transporter permease subunit [Natrialba swarupiae]